MAGFSLPHGGGRSRQFSGLEALIKEEKTAAAGLASVADSAKGASDSFRKIADEFGSSMADTARKAMGGDGAGAAKAAEKATGIPDDVIGNLAERLRASLGGGGVGAGLTASLAKEFNQLGGTITEMSRRVDAFMKFPTFNKAIGGIKTGLLEIGTTGPAVFTGLAHSVVQTAKATWDYSPALSAIILGFGSAAHAVNIFTGTLARGASLAGGVATAIYHPFFRLSNFLSSLGDVAGKSFFEIYRQHGLIVGSTLKLTSLTAGLAKGIFHVGTLGAFKGAANDVATFGKNTQQAQSYVGTLTHGVMGFGRQLAIALGAFGLAFKAVEFFRAGIKGAIDLSHSVDVARNTFGDFSGQVEGAAKELTKLGFVKRELLDAANSFGAVAQGAGMTDRQAAALSQTFMKLTTQATAYFDIPLADAAQKIQSGLAGGNKALRDFGILIDEAAVKTEAARLGLARGKGDLSKYAEMVARASLMQKGFSQSSDFLEKTAGSVQAQFRMAGGGVENFATSIGELLMPAVELAIGGFNDLLAAVIEVFENNLSTITGWAEKVSAAFGTVGVVVRNFGSFWRIAQIKAEEFFANVYAILDTVPENFSRVTSWLGRNWYELLADAVNGFGVAARNLLDNAVNLGQALWDAIQGKGFNFTFKPLLDGFKATAEQFPELMQPVWVSLQGQIDRESAKMAANEAARAKTNLANARKAMGLPPDADKPEKNKLAEAAERGSKEAYSAVVKYQAQGAQKDGWQKVSEIGNKQLNVQQQMLDVMRKQTVGGQPLPVASF